MKNIIAAAVLCLSSGAWATMPTKTTNPAGYAHRASLSYGKEQSDWGEAKIMGCAQNLTEGYLDIICSGQTRVLGPGGGGDFMADYQCHFSMTRESAQMYIITKEECQ